MDSIFENQRQTHEEIERFDRALSTILSRNPASHESRVQNEHHAAQILDRIHARAIELNATYADDARKSELEAISAPPQPTDLSEFYARLSRLQEHHSKYPDAVVGGFELELMSLLEEHNQDEEDAYAEEDLAISLLFSGEEAYGKYLDLYANHSTYCNIKHVTRRPGYLQYLDLLLSAQNGPIHQELPKEARFTKDFESYITDLYSYLVSFAKRTQPLVDIDVQQQDAEDAFNNLWDAGDLKEWEEVAKVDSGGGIWCAACQKQYSKQTVYDAHLTSKKHIKGQTRLEESGMSAANPNGDTPTPALSNQPSTMQVRRRNSARHTYLATNILANLVSTLNDTKSNVERRFSLTAREREQELLEQAKPKAVAPPPKDDKEEEEEEQEERIYNPLKLPLGWDGKPIPFWLYKLHGLGVEYRCEICSDHVYMGRKNFERHFQESRHAFGMRALGLPNTKHFHEIVGIQDALALAEKLKQEGRHEIFEMETMEELEDEEGNVYNRKTYEDLKKQGII
ncbi:hypothetical protein CYLTODRAFT_428350 [Cylindrobasidium torrendii FP15055 ss-10]|uniref:C2H2-type domain-containing protein n=1 Tax=Cylindrobasidium torrendii FP15055 ss-10 TaxID=1314674 RepID=A0A0D7BW07_9AGAR|nr:hypothetical protein CYLTODRAFT_428350 [Cylindrobasidium torrendii FP15055 ss-10]